MARRPRHSEYSVDIFTGEMSRYGYGVKGGTDWVDPNRCRTQSEHPYSYDEYYLWRDTGVEVYNLKGLKADYSDRLMQWNYTRCRQAWDMIGMGESTSSISKQEASIFLSHYFNKQVEAVGVVRGCNVGNGYPYLIFIYKFNDEESK